MTTVLLDSHVLHWWTSDSERLSRRARQAIDNADELAVASTTWWELAWLAHRGRINPDVPVRSWLEDLSDRVRTIATTPAIAATAVALSDSFPRDPSDRVIYATAIEYGWSLVTQDEQLRAHKHPRNPTIW